MTLSPFIRNIDRMFWQRLLYIVYVTILLIPVSACSSLSFGSSFQQDGFNGTGKSSHSHNNSADNAATVDYYYNQHALSNDLWAEIRKNFKINHYENSPQVQAQIAWFMRHQDYLARTVRRAAPFIHYIYQQVKTRNLPSELILLPVIESAYNPFVSSSAGAAGLWQLVPGTARNFGIRQDWWYDGRRDITASTNAALDYLTYLQKFFGGNWLLAIAAYDTGEGNVEAAIRHNVRRGESTEFWALPLAIETQSYVPRLLALAAIIANPKTYPTNLPPINNAPYLGQVEISTQITLEQAAKLAGISLNELKILNPGHRRTILSPNQPYKLLLPIDRIPSFKRNLLELPKNQGNLWGKYKIQSGDTWRRIAKRFSSSIELIKEVNQMRTNKPPVGQILLIPINHANQGAIAVAETESPTETITEGNTDNTASLNQTAQMINPTKQNETLGIEIAAPNLTDAANLDESAINNANKNEELRDLQKTFHIVKAGETLSSIAKRYHVSSHALAHWNHLTPTHTIHSGTRLIILRPKSILGSSSNVKIHHKKSIAPGEIDSSKSISSITHNPIIQYTVREGDTLNSIAKKYNIKASNLAKWNKLSTKPVLHTGQQLIIYRSHSE